MGKLELQFFAWVQLKGIKVVEYGEVSKVLKIEPLKERKLLSGLYKKGFIVRIRRGLYLVPEKLPPGGKWNPGEYVMNYFLMKDAGATYQICGQTAFNFYGLDDQVPNVLYVYNDKISGKRKIGGLLFNYVKVYPSRLGGTKTFTTPDGVEFMLSSLPRTLMDAVYDWKRFNTLPKAYKWITERASDKKLLKELIDMSVKYGNQATIKRVGYLLEKEDANTGLLKKLKQKLSERNSVIPFVPDASYKGKINKKWGIIENGD